jgi:hypothetical protein
MGARLLFGMPMAELTGRVISIRDVLPPRHRDLRDRLQDLPDWDTRCEVLDEALADCLIGARETTNMMAWAVRRIEQADGNLDVRALVRELGYSQKHVITMCRHHVGVPPKLFARIVRFSSSDDSPA